MGHQLSKLNDIPVIALLKQCFITNRNEVVAKVMFLLVSVILLMGVSLSAC